MHSLIAQRIIDVIADTGVNKSKATIIEILERAYGPDLKQVGEVAVTEKPGVVSDVTFVPAFRHTSEINGQEIIAYTITSDTVDEINKRNQAFAAKLNANMAADLDRINQQAKGIIAQSLGIGQPK